MQWRRETFLLISALTAIVIARVMLFSPVTFSCGCELVAELYSFAVLVDRIRNCLRTGERLGPPLLSLWVLMPLPAVIYVHLPIKFFVPALPAIALVLIRLLASLSQLRALSLRSSDAGVWFILSSCCGLAQILQNMVAELPRN